jgi:hypothetical protein
LVEHAVEEGDFGVARDDVPRPAAAAAAQQHEPGRWPPLGPADRVNERLPASVA